MTQDVKDGDVNGLSYIVSYDEDQWNRYTDEQKQFCYDAWAKKAHGAGCVQLFVRLIPDPLFPSGEHTKPYNIYNENFNLSCRFRAKPVETTWTQHFEYWWVLARIPNASNDANYAALKDAAKLAFQAGWERRATL